MTKSSVTISVKALHSLIDPVVPHAAGPDIPVLNSVLIRTRGKYLTAIASDRYRLAMKRIELDEPQAEFASAVPVSTLAQIGKVFRADRLVDPEITLTSDGVTLTVSATGGLGGMAGASIDFNLPVSVKSFPPLERLVRDALVAEPGEGPAGAAFRPLHLTAFKTGQPAGVAIHLSRAGKTWVVRVGVDFIGLVAPWSAAREPAGAESWLDLLDAPAASEEAAA